MTMNSTRPSRHSVRPLLALVAALAAGGCGDTTTPGPDWVEREVTITRTSSDGASIGAVLVSVEGTVDGVDSQDSRAHVLQRDEADRTVVAVTRSTAGSSLAFQVRAPAGETPTVTLLQVADPDNQLVSTDRYEVLIEDGGS